jgi:multiple sugar transport system permease protein
MAAQTAVKSRERFRFIPKGKLARSEALWFWFFISPWVIGFLIFTLYPIVASFYFSLTSYNISSDPVFIGLKNYSDLFGDRVFWKSIQVTAYYSLLSVPTGIALGLLLAVLLNQKVPFLGFFRTIYYLPSLLAGSVAVAVLFQWIMNPQFGIINLMIRSFVGPDGLIPLGITGPRWLQDEDWVMPSYALMALWAFGATMLIYLSALQGVPTACSGPHAAMFTMSRMKRGRFSTPPLRRKPPWRQHHRPLFVRFQGVEHGPAGAIASSRFR